MIGASVSLVQTGISACVQLKVWAYSSRVSGQSQGSSDLALHGGSFAEIARGQFDEILPGTGRLWAASLTRPSLKVMSGFQTRSTCLALPTTF